MTRNGTNRTPESFGIEDVSVGPAVIDDGDCCERCGDEIPVGTKVRLVTLGTGDIEEWCSSCAQVARHEMTDDTTGTEIGQEVDER